MTAEAMAKVLGGHQTMPECPAYSVTRGCAMTGEDIEAAMPLVALTVFLGEPVEAVKGGEGGDFKITNAEFIAAVFPRLHEGAFVAVSSPVNAGSNESRDAVGSRDPPIWCIWQTVAAIWGRRNL
jgi:hypothetical protein